MADLAPQRASLVRLMQQTVDDQQRHNNWRYWAVRPQTILSHYIAGGRVDTDCSDGCRLLSRWAGVADPAGNNYAPYGNSSSIWAHLPHAPLKDVEPGDIFTFGYSSGEKHACMAFNTDPDPLVWNMGAPGQPVLRRLSNEIAAHRGMTVTLCKQPIAKPVPPPPPSDAETRLRSETGFYGWVAWRLGEGPWRAYGPRNPKVRPAVPKVIPLGWWRRLSVFRLNRKKGNEPA